MGTLARPGEETGRSAHPTDRYNFRAIGRSVFISLIAVEESGLVWDVEKQQEFPNCQLRQQNSLKEMRFRPSFAQKLSR
jgi:hypothetical protein